MLNKYIKNMLLFNIAGDTIFLTAENVLGNVTKVNLQVVKYNWGGIL